MLGGAIPILATGGTTEGDRRERSFTADPRLKTERLDKRHVGDLSRGPAFCGTDHGGDGLEHLVGIAVEGRLEQPDEVVAGEADLGADRRLRSEPGSDASAEARILVGFDGLPLQGATSTRCRPERPKAAEREWFWGRTVAVRLCRAAPWSATVEKSSGSQEVWPP